MRWDRAPRRLAVGDTAWLWRVEHRRPECGQELTLCRADDRHARLRPVFRAGPGYVTCGAYWGPGLIRAADGETLDLHEPGVVRRFLDEAAARGLPPTAHGTREADGWPPYDALVGRAGA